MSADFDISISFPESILVGEETDVIVDVNVEGTISNGLLVGVLVPDELTILSAKPDDGLIVDNAIMWVLEPKDHRLSFRVRSNVSGAYDIKAKVGTDKNGFYEEVYDQKTLIVQSEEAGWIIVDVNRDGKISTNELLEAVNKWIAGSIDTDIVLEAINIWISA